MSHHNRRSVLTLHRYRGYGGSTGHRSWQGCLLLSYLAAALCLCWKLCCMLCLLAVAASVCVAAGLSVLWLPVGGCLPCAGLLYVMSVDCCGHCLLLCAVLAAVVAVCVWCWLATGGLSTSDAFSLYVSFVIVCIGNRTITVVAAVACWSRKKT